MRLAAILGLTLIALTAFAAQRVDYTTDEEADLIRDAQGIEPRVALFLKLADNRLVVLGLRERTAKEREQTKKDIEKYEKEVKDAAKVKDAEIRAKPVNPDIYLRDHTRTELLRGYIQVLDEVMSNIDDTYERKLDVRSAVEELEKFVRQQIPLLRKFEPKTDRESAAIKAVIEHSEQTLSDVRAALEVIPKTERKPRQ